MNRLVHLAGWGNYQISHIDQIAEHCPWNVQKNKNPGEESMEEKKVIINSFVSSCRYKLGMNYETIGEFFCCRLSLMANRTNLGKILAYA